MRLTIAVALLLLATFLRAHQLGAQSLWLDELLQADAARESLGEIVAQVPQFSAMPLDYFIIHGWQRLGEQDFWLRLPAVFWSVLTVAVMGRFARRFFDAPVGLAAMALLAVAPFAVQYAQEMRPYALWGLWMLTSYYFLLRALQTANTKFWLAFSIASALALFTHLFTLFTLGTQGLLAFIYAARQRTPRPALLFTAACVFSLSGLLLTPYPASVLGVGQVFATSLLNPASLTAEAALKPNQELGPILNAAFFNNLLTTLAGEVWPWVFVALAGLGLVRARQQRLALSAWLLLPAALTVLFLISRGTFFAVRYITPSHLALVLLAALGLRWLARRPILLFPLTAALMVFSLFSVQAYYQTRKEDWRTAGQFLNANARAGDGVIAPLAGPIVFHYAPQARPFRFDTPLPEGAPTTFTRLWFLRHPYLGPAAPAWEAWLALQPSAVEYRIDGALSWFIIGPAASETLATLTPPATPWAYVALGQEYELRDDATMAETYFERALALNDAAEFATPFGDFLRRRNENDRAAQIYLRALERNPNAVPALVGLSRLYLQANVPAEAVRALTWAAQQAPDDYAVNYFLWQAYTRTNQPEAAAAAQARAARLFPELPEPP